MRGDQGGIQICKNPGFAIRRHVKGIGESTTLSEVHPQLLTETSTSKSTTDETTLPKAWSLSTLKAYPQTRMNVLKSEAACEEKYSFLASYLKLDLMLICKKRSQICSL